MLQTLRKAATGRTTILISHRLNTVLDALARGETPKAGTQEPGRHTVEPLGGPTTLKEMVAGNHDYRGEW